MEGFREKARQIYLRKGLEHEKETIKTMARIDDPEVIEFSGEETKTITIRSDLTKKSGNVVVAMEVSNATKDSKLKISNVKVKEANKLQANGWELYAASDLGGEATLETSSNKKEHVINVTAVGDKEDYSVVYKKTGLSVKEGTKYKVSFEAKSSADRVIKAAFMDPNDNYYYLGGGDYELTNEYKAFSFVMPADPENKPIKTTSTGMIQFSLGYLADKKCGPSKVSIKNIVFAELLPVEEIKSDEVTIGVNSEENLLKDVTVNGNIFNGESAGYVKKTTKDGEAKITILKSGTELSNIKFMKDNLKLDKGSKYKFSLDLFKEVNSS